jgi:hypothetical protein
VLALGQQIDGLHDFPNYALPGCDIPATASMAVFSAIFIVG